MDVKKLPVEKLIGRLQRAVGFGGRSIAFSHGADSGAL
jgi:hypothetical protein